jgi:peptidyl-tRNA hydrolase
MAVKTKQIIVVRRDLKMKHGKMAAQVAHAAMSFLTREGRISWNVDFLDYFVNNWYDDGYTKAVLAFGKAW